MLICLCAGQQFDAAVAAPKQSIFDKLALFPPHEKGPADYIKGLKLGFPGELQELSVPGPNGNKIDCALLRMPESKYIFLVSHGNAGDLKHALRLATLIAKTGQSVMVYDYEGFGRSQGIAKLKNLTPDGFSVYDYLINALGYKDDQIILYGESIGTAPTAQIMEERHPRAVVLQSGFTSLVAAGREKVWATKLIPAWLVNEPHFDNLHAVKHPHPPLLFIHGDEDEVLDVNYSRKMFKEASGPKQYFEVKGAGHNDIGKVDPDGFCRALCRLIDSFENSVSEDPKKDSVVHTSI